MTGSTRIFFGDLVRALALAGHPSGEDWSAIAGMLGFSRQARVSAGKGRGLSPAAAGSEARGSEGAVPAPPAKIAPPETGAGEFGDLMAFTLDRQPAQPVLLPPPVVSPPELARGPGLRLLPLFDPLWERGILIEAVGRRLAEGEIAVGAAVEAIARGEALAEAPRELILSAGKGCHLLIDTGVGMRPFRRDCRDLAVALRHAAGAEHTRVLRFIDCPSQGVLNEAFDDEPYRPPENGAIVLAVSDLCSGGPGSAIRRASPQDWLGVARVVRDAGSALVVLNPYPSETWPEMLQGRFPIIPWDRGVRASDVRRARRKSR